MKRLLKVFSSLLIVGILCVSNVYADNSWIGLIYNDGATNGNYRTVNFRKAPSTTAEKFNFSLYVGQDVTVLSDAGNNFYQVRLTYKDKNVVGYVHQANIVKYSPNTNYQQTLRNAGCPESYIRYIEYIHTICPKWTFTFVNTNIDFVEATSKFSQEARVQSVALSDPSRGQDSYAWWYANTSTVAYYLDPRNMLQVNTALMFEDLSNYSTCTETQVQAVLSGSAIAGTLPDDSSKTWAKAFIEAGASAHVSPIYLASLAATEQGSSGNLCGLGGYSPNDSTKKYYNVFDIGATDTGNDGTTSIDRGLSYAQSQGWDTAQKGITFGAQYIAEKYISKGQNTIYYQRFNVNPSRPSGTDIHTHSYQTNIQACETEGRKTFKSYINTLYNGTNALEDGSYNLLIPIYNNMPASPAVYPTSTPVQLSGYIVSLSYTNTYICSNDKTPVVYISGLSQNVDYSVSYSNNTDIGTATATIVGTGSYTGTLTANYTISDHPYAHNTVGANCESGGYTTHTCTNCGYSYTDSYTDALGHAWYLASKASITRNSVNACSRCGVQTTGGTTTSKTIYKGNSYNEGVSGTWKSSNKKIATVSKSGKITAKKAGKCTITAKVNGQTYKCKITVKNKSLSVSKSSVSIKKGKSIYISAKASPSATIKWSTSNKKIASVSNGTIKGKKKGSCIVYAKANGITKKIKVKVK